MIFADFDEPNEVPPADISHLRHLVLMRQRTEAEIGELEVRLKDINSQIQTALAGAEIGLLDGKEVVRRVQVTQEKFSSTTLKERDPETYAKYVRPSTFWQMRWKEIT